MIKEQTTKEAATKSEWTLEKLRRLKNDELVELFKTLDAPPLSEIKGEYAGELLNQGNWFYNFSAQLMVSSHLSNGKWLGKAFATSSDIEGHGYNSFVKWGKVRRHYRMKTSVVPSRYDGKPIFQLYYAAYDHLLGKVHMVDEVRKLVDGIYLGIGTWGFTDKQRMRPGPFVLSGPIAEFVGSDREESFENKMCG